MKLTWMIVLCCVLALIEVWIERAESEYEHSDVPAKAVVSPKDDWFGVPTTPTKPFEWNRSYAVGSDQVTSFLSLVGDEPFGVTLKYPKIKEAVCPRVLIDYVCVDSKSCIGKQARFSVELFPGVFGGFHANVNLLNPPIGFAPDSLIRLLEYSIDPFGLIQSQLNYRMVGYDNERPVYKYLFRFPAMKSEIYDRIEVKVSQQLTNSLDFASFKILSSAVIEDYRPLPLENLTIDIEKNVKGVILSLFSRTVVPEELRGLHLSFNVRDTVVHSVVKAEATNSTDNILVDLYQLKRKFGLLEYKPIDINLRNECNGAMHEVEIQFEKL